LAEVAVSWGNGWWACQDLNLGPHPYQVSRAKRCADRRFPRSLLSVRGEGMRSNASTGNASRWQFTIAPRGSCWSRAREAGHGDWVGGSQSHPGRCPRLAQALASAFQDDPVIAWSFPDQHRRRAVLRAFMEFRLRKLAFPHDQVWMTAEGAAAAVWLPPPGRWQLSRPQRLRLLPALSGSLAGGPPRSWVGWSAWRRGTPTIGPTGSCSSWAPTRRRRDEGWARPCSPTSSPAWTPRGCLPTWSPPASGTSPCMAATASRSPARSRSRAARGSGRCGASPALER
jgi:hypothetical protein